MPMLHVAGHEVDEWLLVVYAVYVGTQPLAWTALTRSVEEMGVGVQQLLARDMHSRWRRGSKIYTDKHKIDD